jgi:predicted HD superfamily hydrolase involved in NAD metabolism
MAKARAWVTPRISEYRFNHTAGVAIIAHELAKHARIDPFVAELGGWLHDACKEHKATQLVKEARAFGMKLNVIEQANGHLLHGPVAALTAKAQLKITNKDLLDGIAQHTLGAVDMTPLSQVLFLADCLEEGRPEDFTIPIWEALGYKIPKAGPKKRKFVGPLDMDAAILVACDLSLQYLLEDGKVIHPKTVEVRNWYLNQIKQRKSP